LLKGNFATCKTHTGGDGVSDDFHSSDEHSHASATDEGFTTWLFCGCDEGGHAVILGLSAVALCAGITMMRSLEANDPDTALGEPVGSITAYTGGTFAALGFGGLLLLRVTNKRVQARRTASNSKKHPPAATVMETRNEVPSRFIQIPRLQTAGLRASSLLDDSLLASLKDKSSTRINIQFEKLGLRLNSTGQELLAGVDGHINAGCVTAIMVREPY
jgi:hypothetical protein